MDIWLWKCHRCVCLGTCFSKVLFVEILLTSMWTPDWCWCQWMWSLSEEREEAILSLWTITGDTSTILYPVVQWTYGEDISVSLIIIWTLTLHHHIYVCVAHCSGCGGSVDRLSLWGCVCRNWMSVPHYHGPLLLSSMALLYVLFKQGILKHGNHTFS